MNFVCGKDARGGARFFGVNKREVVVFLTLYSAMQTVRFKTLGGSYTAGNGFHNPSHGMALFLQYDSIILLKCLVKKLIS